MFDLVSPELSVTRGVEWEVPALFWRVMALGSSVKLKGISCQKDNPGEITRSRSSRNNVSPRCTSGVMSNTVATAWMHIQISMALSVMSLFASPRYIPSLALNFVMCVRRGCTTPPRHC